MSVVVEIANQTKLERAKELLGAKTESEAIEIALEKIIEEFERKEINEETEEFDLDELDVHKLNRIPPKKSFTVKAHFKIGGRGEPMKYDLSDYNFDEYEQ